MATVPLAGETGGFVTREAPLATHVPFGDPAWRPRFLRISNGHFWARAGRAPISRPLLEAVHAEARAAAPSRLARDAGGVAAVDDSREARDAEVVEVIAPLDADPTASHL